ncbi:MAG: hypothetical protein U0136_12910 [Bdellovibrionota bacterium]
MATIALSHVFLDALMLQKKAQLKKPQLHAKQNRLRSDVGTRGSLAFHKFDAYLSCTASDLPIGEFIARSLDHRGAHTSVPSVVGTTSTALVGSTTADVDDAKASDIQSSSCFVLVLSRDASRDTGVLAELKVALRARVPVIVFRIEPVVPEAPLKSFLNKVVLIDALTAPVEPHLDVLSKAILQLRVGRDSLKQSVRPKSIRPIMAILATVALSAVLLFLYGSSRRASPPELTTSAQPSQPAAVESTVLSEPEDPSRPTTVVEAMRGRWIFEIPSSGVSMHRQISPYSYSAQTVMTETGKIHHAEGTVTLEANGQRPRTSEWTVLDATHIRANIVPESVRQAALMSAADDPAARDQIAEALSTAVWNRVGDDAKGAATYELHPVIPGQSWQLTFVESPIGEYTLHGTLAENGTYVARDGRWTSTSASGRKQEGSYELVDGETVALSTGFGRYLWKREGAASPSAD